MKVLNDAEFLLLYDLYRPQNLDLPCDLYPYFDFQNLTEDECVAEFRFRKQLMSQGFLKLCGFLML